MGGLPSDITATNRPRIASARGDIGGDDPVLERSGIFPRSPAPWAMGSGGSGGSGDGGYPQLDPGSTDEPAEHADEPINEGTVTNEEHLNQLAGEPGLPADGSADFEDDDDFGDFEGNVAVASNTDGAAAEDDQWGFAPVQSPEGISVEDHNKLVLKLIETWRESMPAPLGLDSQVSPDSDDKVTDWDSWLQTQSIPEEAQELVRCGVSTRVPIVPFSKLGIKEPDPSRVFGAKVREEFLNSLGKHLQLPKPTSSPGSPTSPAQNEIKAQTGALAAAGPSVAPVGDGVETDHADRGESMTNMVDADWGLLENVGHLPESENIGPKPSQPSDTDVLSQALNSVGLSIATAPGPAAHANEGGLGAEEKRKKKGMTHKVKSFLSGLPDLKHLYSKSVVT
ncbi:unnamed protein product [Durusdinium trenchii]|uniref:Uncharacterized protein n=1 Tax=Durusdinium trenchii TaxID=1381693 RepID=A0ABP0KAX3_9DINO